MPSDPDTPVFELRNIGPVSAKWLESIGIKTRSDLEEAGAVFVYRILKEQKSRVNVNLLYALHGALTDTHWTAFSDETRKWLKNEVKEAMRVPPSGG